jgi:uncharacterized membrane-anchored protein YhcB (DUF1043 family)
VGNIFRALSGEPVEAERIESSMAGPRLLSEQDTTFIARLLQGLENRLTQRVTEESQQTRTEIRAGREDLHNLQDQLEANINASAEMIHKYVVERLQAYQEQLADCECKLSVDHSEFWEQLGHESRRYLATGDYIRQKSPVGMECSGEAIEYAKAIESEIRKHLVAPFDAFSQGINPGASIFRHEASQVTLGGFIAVFERSEIRSNFIKHLGEKGDFLSKEFYLLKEIKKLRDIAAHGGDIGRRQATNLGDMVFKLLPKIVALGSS